MKSDKKVIFIALAIFLSPPILLMAYMFVLVHLDEVVTVEVIQPPYKRVYVVGEGNILDMEGCIIRIHTRGGDVADFPFDEQSFVQTRHRINFFYPGEYEVHFYWQNVYLYSTTVWVVEDD